MYKLIAQQKDTRHEDQSNDQTPNLGFWSGRIKQRALRRICRKIQHRLILLFILRSGFRP